MNRTALALLLTVEACALGSILIGAPRALGWVALAAGAGAIVVATNDPDDPWR